MVHALEEAARVLATDGHVIDLRPLALDMPFEVETPEGVDQLGHIDGAPGLAADVACLSAERRAISAGTLLRDRVQYVTFALYWRNLDELKAYLDKYWRSRRRHPPSEQVEAAGHLLAVGGSAARVRVREILRLVRFRKGSRAR
jgi:hypothetical protein